MSLNPVYTRCVRCRKLLFLPRGREGRRQQYFGSFKQVETSVGFRVEGLGFRVLGLGLRVKGSEMQAVWKFLMNSPREYLTRTHRMTLQSSSGSFHD